MLELAAGYTMNVGETRRTALCGRQNLHRGFESRTRLQFLDTISFDWHLRIRGGQEGADDGTDCALRDSIHVEPAGVSAHRILVCRAPPRRASSRAGLSATAVGPRISHRRRDDPGSGRRRPRRADGIPDDDWIWRLDNGIPRPAGTGRASRPPPGR